MVKWLKVRFTTNVYFWVIASSITNVTIGWSLYSCKGDILWDDQLIYQMLIKIYPQRAFNHNAAPMYCKDIFFKRSCNVFQNLVKPYSILSGNFPWKTNSDFMTKQSTVFRSYALPTDLLHPPLDHSSNDVIQGSHHYQRICGFKKTTHAPCTAKNKH